MDYKINIKNTLKKLQNYIYIYLCRIIDLKIFTKMKKLYLIGTLSLMMFCLSAKAQEKEVVFPVGVEDATYKSVISLDDNTTTLYIVVSNNAVEGIFKDKVNSKNILEKVNVKFFPLNDLGTTVADIEEERLSQRGYKCIGTVVVQNTEKKDSKYYVLLYAKNKKDCWYKL